MSAKSKPSKGKKEGLSRRSFLKWSAVAGAGSALVPAGVRSAHAGDLGKIDPQGSFPLEEATIEGLQQAMESHQVTARELVRMYLDRINEIDRHGPRLLSLIETNPDAVAIANQLDAERAKGHVRGPMHGIPVVVKDNYDTADRMLTAAGSRALSVDGLPAIQDSTAVAKLREAGAIILAKANLSEWANFRSSRSVSGWSGRGRQCLNPYVIDRSPCGSSSGSAAAVSANLATASLGTETNGSILCPSSINGCAAIKTTVGLTSRAGVVPIAHSQDCVGPICRTVADAATVLGPLTGVDPRDPATFESEGHFYQDYRQFLDPGALNGARIGILRRNYFGQHEHTDRVVEPTLQILRDLGAEVVDSPSIFIDLSQLGNRTTQVLLDEFKHDINVYLASRPNLGVQTLEDLIAFNDADAANEMPYFLQELFISARDTGRPLEDPGYIADLAFIRRVGGQDGIDRVMQENNLDALFAPSRGPTCTIDLINGDRFFVGSSTPGAIAGYPTVTVPAGFVFNELPIGVSFMGGRWSEPTLIGFAYAFEQATHARHPPRFLRTLNLP
jgi:amidase